MVHFGMRPIKEESLMMYLSETILLTIALGVADCG